MKTYRTPGATATEWSPTGNAQEVQRMETLINPANAGVSVPVTLSLKGETTRKGSRRVVLRSEATLPGTLINDMMGQTMIDPKASQSISAHVVMTMPQILAQTEIPAETTTGALALVGNMLSDIFAVLSDESATTNADFRKLTGLVAKSLAGATPLDLVSGAYGESTPRS